MTARPARQRRRRIVEVAACRFCVWVWIELALKLNRDSWAPISPRALDTVSIAVSSRPSMAVASGWFFTSMLGPCCLALQLQFLPEMSFARIGLMGSAPRRPCEDIGVRDAPLGKLRGDTADFLDRPADQERRFGRDRSFVFLSDRPALAR